MTDVTQKDRRQHAVTDERNPYFDYIRNVNVIRVLPGACKVTDDPTDMLATTLGSCVSACIRDIRTGYGGMNHFMLPANRGQSSWGDEKSKLRYGDQAMEYLIEKIMARGCAKSDLEIKIFGGGNVMKSLSNVGTENAEYILEYLDKKGLKVEACDLGGPYPRRIHYFPATGKVERLFLRRSSDVKFLDEEESLLRKCMDLGVSPARNKREVTG